MWRCACAQVPCVGLDCGVYLPGQAPRKKASAKTPAEMAAIRAKAWETRRAKLPQLPPQQPAAEGSK